MLNKPYWIGPAIVVGAAIGNGSPYITQAYDRHSLSTSKSAHKTNETFVQEVMDDDDFKTLGNNRLYFKPAELTPEEIHNRTNAMFEAFQESIRQIPKENDDEKLLLIAKLAQNLSRLHPFSFACGRVVTLVINWCLLQQGFPPSLDWRLSMI
ncbi:MAG: Fic family protein [Coxiellaceae bacterium]|nr:MAG: Fic family protein [Coxiellaceae bacterium]